MNNSSVPAASSRRILLVAADLPFRESSVAALCDAGYCAEGEGDAEVAWETLGRRGYELLVVDHQLPVSSGLRLILRMHHANLTLPVILITEDSLNLGPLTHDRLRLVTLLPRPFDTERLLELVLVALPSPSPAQAIHSHRALPNTAHIPRPQKKPASLAEAKLPTSW